MPKENTHIYFADNLRAKITKQSIKELVDNNLDYYYLGSITPDVFWYSKDKKIEKIAKHIHGDSNITNEIIFELLDVAKESKSEEDLAFILGFLTHCSLDITFHPMIMYLTGNYHSPDKEIGDRAKYSHRHFETYLDEKLKHDFSIAKNTSVCSLKDLTVFNFFCSKFQVTSKELVGIYKRHRFLTGLFRNSFVFSAASFLNKINIMHNYSELALFYNILKKDKKEWGDEFDYQDLIDGSKLHANVKALFSQATDLALDYFSAAWDYYQGNIDLSKGKEVIAGNSLTTGKVDKRIKDMKYFKINY